MEFFNYEYCSSLHKHNEIENINILKNNIKLDIKKKEKEIDNLLESDLKNMLITKFNLLTLKNFIIKLILLLYKNKNEIKQNSSLILKINYDINNNNIKYNIGLFQLNYSVNKIKTNIINKYNLHSNSLVAHSLSQETIKENLSIDNLINFITLDLNKLKSFLIVRITNKNKTSKLQKLILIQYKELLICILNYESSVQLKSNVEKENNLFSFRQILYKILQYDKIISINNCIIDFFKFKHTITKKNTELNKQLHKLNKNNNSNIKKNININKQITNKVKLYNKIFKSISIKKNNTRNLINNCEKNIKKSINTLLILDDKLNELEHFLENLHKIDCPEDIKSKCVTVHKDDCVACCICLNNIDLGVKTVCGHLYHVHCINLYIYSIINDNNDDIKILCPLCRKFI